MKNIPLSVQIWALCAGVTLCVFGLIMLFLPGMLNSFFTGQVYTLLEDSQKQIQFLHFKSNLPEQDGAAITVTLPAIKSDSPESTQEPSGQPSDRINTPPPLGDGQQQTPDNAGKMTGVVSLEGVSTSTSTDLGQVSIYQPATLIAFSSIGLGNDPSGLPPVSHILLPDDPNSQLPSALPEAFTKIVREQAKGQTEETRRYSHTEGTNTLLYVIRNQVLEGKPVHLVSYAWASYTRNFRPALPRSSLGLWWRFAC